MNGEGVGGGCHVRCSCLKEKGLFTKSAFDCFICFFSHTQSTLLSTLTKTESECAAYEFTTLTCIPGVIEVRV